MNDVEFTHNLHWRNTPHQLLKECGLAVWELPDTVPNEHLLVLWKAITVPSLKQATR